MAGIAGAMRFRGLKRKYKLLACVGFLVVLLLFPTLPWDGNQPEPPALQIKTTPAAHVAIKAVPETKAPEPAPTPTPTAEGVLIPSGLTAAELEQGLLGDLKQYAGCFIEAERETGINAVFLASVAALESGWAKSDVAVNKNNLFGWTSQSGYRGFSSKETCIAFVAEKIKALYLTPEGEYFNGYTVEGVNIRYNGRTSWAEQVNQIMSEITARAEKVKEDNDESY